MTIKTELNSLQDFEAGGGAVETLDSLTNEQQDDLWAILENDIFPEGCDETELNDFLWFENDYIAEILGFEDWESLTDCNEA